jgi:hypothetical protein
MLFRHILFLLPVTRAIRISSRELSEGEPDICDVVFVGAGHFTAGALIELRHEHPEWSACVVDMREAVGGAWNDANTWSRWVTPYSSPGEMKLYYMHEKTGLKSNVTKGIAHTKDVLNELQAIYDWSGPRMYLSHKVDRVSGSEVVATSMAGGKARRILARKFVLAPNYRNMNSFNDSSTRKDNLLSWNLTQFDKIVILGNSMQAAEMINEIYEVRTDDRFSLEVLYRNAHPLYPYMNCTHQTGELFLNFACRSCSIPALSDSMRLYRDQASQSGLDHGIKFMFIQKIMEPRMQKILSFRQVQHMSEHSGAVGRTLTLDARNNVKDISPLAIDGSSKVAQPSLSWNSIFFMKRIFDTSKNSMNDPPIGSSVLRTGHSYMCTLLRNNFTEPEWNEEEKYMLNQFYHNYQTLAKKYSCYGHDEPWQGSFSRISSWLTCKEFHKKK